MMMLKRKKKDNDLAFEDSLNDDWNRDLNTVEVPIGNRPLWYLGIFIFAAVLAVGTRVAYLNFSNAYYNARAKDNASAYQETPTPRGIIYDREGDVLAENQASFSAVLDAHAFVTDPALTTSTEQIAQSIFSIDPSDLENLVGQASAQNFATPIVLANELTQNQLVNLQAQDNPAIKIESDFVRTYPNGPVFSSVIGYTGRVSAADLADNPSLSATDMIGKAGVEAYDDSTLRGTPGITVQYENAQGKVLGGGTQSSPQIGAPLTLTIDGGLQEYLYQAVAAGLKSLGKTIGLGLAIDPQNGQVLALVNLPGYDNNVFSEQGTGSEIEQLLTSSEKPLLNRVVNGVYNPGSTIKPLDAVAALKENVIDPTREIFSPGYILIPNPYNASTPTRYADWRYQGFVNMAAALAQSSDVYFYVVGGGSPAETTPLLNDPSDYGIGGLGIDRLHEWWQTFGLGVPTGIDLPDESVGFLPTAAWKQQKTGTPWLLGDTYNVAIGQGNLLLTPLQLLDYVGAIANGGTIWRPYLNANSTPKVDEDLTYLLPQIKTVQQGMVEGVSSPLGTAHTLNNLPVRVCAKTGSAQVADNTQENALFVGYAPCNNPQIVLLILIENSKDGSLNAVPIAKQVMEWYYVNRLEASGGGATSSSTAAQ